MHTMKNKVQLIGHLGNDPEVKAIASGKKMARFSIATNERYQNTKGERVTETQWHNLIAWGKLADIAARYLEKGREVMVEGKLVNRQYEDKNGQRKYTTEIQVQELLLLSGGHRSAAE